MATRKKIPDRSASPTTRQPDSPPAQAPGPGPVEPGRESGLFVASVAKAFDVLRIVSAAPEPLGLTEVVQLTHMGRSAVQRFLHTLTTLGYLRQDPRTRCYSVTPCVLGFAQGFLGRDGVRSKASELLRVASLECGETLNFTVLEKTSVLYLVRHTGRHAVSVELSVGSRLPVYSSAPGRAMLAFMDPAEARLVLERSEMKPFTPYTELSIEKFLASFPATRRLGYYVSDQEGFIGDISIAAPVFDHGGGLAGAVNVAVSTSRWTARDAEVALAPVVLRVAERLSAALGHGALASTVVD